MTAEGRWNGTGMRFTGMGHYFPSEIIDNQAIQNVRTNAIEDKILGNLGVHTRHRSDDIETVQFMAVKAAQAALDAAGTDAADVDVLILSNWTDRLWGPELAPRVASDLGCGRTLSFDVCGGCAGFVLGTQTAALHLGDHAKNAVIVSSENFTSHVRPGSKGELVTGDGAGAAVLTRDPAATGTGLIDSQIHSDGVRHELTGAYPPNGWVRSSPNLIDEAITSVCGVVDEILTRNDLSITDIDWVIPHSGTEPILAGIRKAAGISDDQFLTNFSRRGNLSSASIPTVLSEETASGRISPGDLVLAPAVGGGWFYGGLLFRV